MSGFKFAAAWLASLVLFVPALAQAQAQLRGGDVVTPDPAVRQGVLPNGLHYALVTNHTPSKSISIRLVMAVGSYDETDAERGYAHFIEHMAFNGTAHIPSNRLDTVFGAEGVAFGRDQNAETSYFTTLYMLDVPQLDAGKLDLAFTWLRDIADGEKLEAAAMDRERGVVLAEDDRSKGPERDLAERLQKFLSPELRTTLRDPIGTRATVSAATPADLRAFYERWYRPEFATVVVVGDLPTDELERRVTAAFSSWTGKGPAPARPRPSRPDLMRGFDVLTVTEPNLPSLTEVCFTHPDDEHGPDTVARMKRLAERSLWREVLNERLRALAESDDPPFTKAVLEARESEHEALYDCLATYPVGNDWGRALQASLAEVRRLQAHGLGEAETGRALGRLRASFRAASEGAATETNASAAQRFVANLTQGDVVASPHERFRILDRAIADTDEKTVSRAFQRDWAGGAGPLILLVTPKPVPAKAVRAAWREVASRPAPPAVADHVLTWAYSDFGAPGKELRRETIANPGFERVTFANGVVLNFKALSVEHERVKVRVRFGAGRREIAKGDFFTAQLGANLFTDSGLGKHDAETLRRLFSNHGWEVKFGIGDDAFELFGDTNSTDLQSEMQILAAYVSDPGFRRATDARLPTALETMIRQSRVSPEFALSQALNRAIAPDGAYLSPPREALLKINTAAFERIFKPALTQAPLEVTIVGDTTLDRAVGAVARTLGALPPRPATPRERAGAWFLRYPAVAPPEIRTTYESTASKAVISLIWPLYVAEPSRRREEYALNILANALDDAIRHKVRAEMGKSYAPTVGMSAPDKADQGDISAIIETDAADVDAVTKAARDTALAVSASGVSAEAFEAARKPVLDRGVTRLESLDSWMDGLDGSASDPEILREFVDWDADMHSVTLDDVNRAAKAWLSKPPIVTIATPVPPTP